MRRKVSFNAFFKSRVRARDALFEKLPCLHRCTQLSFCCKWKKWDFCWALVLVINGCSLIGSSVFCRHFNHIDKHCRLVLNKRCIKCAFRWTRFSLLATCDCAPFCWRGRVCCVSCYFFCMWWIAERSVRLLHYLLSPRKWKWASWWG